jgi:hypothetical protein
MDKKKKVHACRTSPDGHRDNFAGFSRLRVSGAWHKFCCSPIGGALMLAFNRLRIDPGDDSAVVDYRIGNGFVESRVVSEMKDESDRSEESGSESGWKRLTPEELSSHVLANTVVARWLKFRMGVFPLVQACYPDRPNREEQRSDRVAA